MSQLKLRLAKVRFRRSEIPGCGRQASLRSGWQLISLHRHRVANRTLLHQDWKHRGLAQNDAAKAKAAELRKAKLCATEACQAATAASARVRLFSRRDSSLRKKRCAQNDIARQNSLSAARAGAAQVVTFGSEAGHKECDGDERKKGFH